MPDAKLTDALPTDALKDSGQRLLTLLVQRAAEAATDRVTGLTDKLDGITENGGTGLRKALGGRDSDEADRDSEEGAEGDRDRDDSGDGSGGGFFAGLKEKVSGMFGGESGGGGGSGSGKKLKVTNIVEEQDIGLPLRTTYDLWTQLSDFPSFMKKVESVEQVSDEKTHWKAQVFLSHREWEATTVEQVPDSHIVWRSTGAKGHVDGAVAFTELGPNLTRVLLVLEYWPQGLFERTGNIWRAQGRRARLEFKHFRRHAMTTAILHQDEIEGWRGEIRDSEVVKTHEEALEEEERAGGRDGEDERGAGRGDDRDESDEYADDEYADDEYADDEADDEAGDRDEDAETDEYDDAEYDDEGTDEGADDEYADDEAGDGTADDYEETDDEPAEDEYAEDEYADDDEGARDEADEAEDEQPARRRSARRRPATAGRSR
ncbi:cyclase/dehydrase [Pseudonocardia dioxanivorans CB1190]|uniref:Cyclase/dehydrase n=1 Tax=Pseudonocardia dioxanivorans (strain ATCC 55486 / DSM 44775 / JCM 13855 / CB1190) TaxID=675635 RepID=F4CUD2_PSEUX|nr:SRPBCC family protein [Pseudonocardia dioxanivorans]AEA24591.1 cyclase/dehydrase [Pseudonocardia dioxanivorans CB1190]